MVEKQYPYHFFPYSLRNNLSIVKNTDASCYGWEPKAKKKKPGNILVLKKVNFISMY